MYRIGIRRICEMNAPYELVAYTSNDWTHLPVLHRKSVMEHRLLYKSGNRMIWLYKSRVLYPFPFHNMFLVFREQDLENDRYWNLYYDLSSGAVHYLKASVERRGITRPPSESTSSLSPIWRLMPRLFFMIFNWRLKRIMDEDSRWIQEWMEQGGIDNRACAPPIPEAHDLFDALFKGKEFPEADVYRKRFQLNQVTR